MIELSLGFYYASSVNPVVSEGMPPLCDSCNEVPQGVWAAQQKGRFLYLAVLQQQQPHADLLNVEQMLPLYLCPLPVKHFLPMLVSSLCVHGEAEARTGPSDQGAVGKQELAGVSDFGRIRTP